MWENFAVAERQEKVAVQRERTFYFKAQVNELRKRKEAMNDFLSIFNLINLPISKQNPSLHHLKEPVNFNKSLFYEQIGS